MAEKIKLVRGDINRPQIQATLTDENTGDVIDITNATVLLKFRQTGATTLTDTITGTIIDPTNGVVVFAMSQTALAGEPGDYEGEIEVTFDAGGGVQTVYELLKFFIREQF